MPVRVERQGYVTTVVLSRPEARNAVDGPTAAELADAFRAFEDDGDARVAVLWGEGGTFCAGADLKAIGTKRGNRVAEDGDGPMGPTRMRLSKPVIAAVAGHAVAGGLELALWCDLRVAEEDAVFGVFCRRWGVPLIDGGTVRLPRLIGTGRAMDMILTGRPVPAPEAHAIGLADRVVPAGRARAEAEELAAAIARFPQECLRSDRASVLEQEGREESAALRGELRHGLGVPALGREGAARFAAGAGRHGSFAESGTRDATDRCTGGGAEDPADGSTGGTAPEGPGTGQA
ncbi:crotonase/enoyl-CoA hydratase family protein [Streptomyces tropicalis]|uniref:Crotonase/enoyl-CoA hydratase family protein n=1 Tax=Streptomyces tropicalis TaxID=3034234 RepID=A0ABT6AAT8_9ACTN|nr:crotonase/enoyl-CoA hydratase family protein [Streptomyces tropicalis]MDF3301769.1 crotonase/enoyl-CoA hydratase family protein [Streptomyces tropicalis]